MKRWQRRLVVGAVVSVALVWSACSKKDDPAGGTSADVKARCVTLCQTQNACQAGTPVDCQPTCDEYASANATSGCEAQYEAALSCWEHLADPCVVVGCDAEEQAYLTCLAIYCVTHPDNAACNGNVGGSGPGGSAPGGSGPGGNGAGGGGATGGGAPSVCPYAAPVLSCAQACQNLKTVAGTCENDPSVPAQIQQLLTLANTGNGAGCTAACAADSPTYTDQWKCFQAAPASPCTAIAGCTAFNCPP